MPMNTLSVTGAMKRLNKMDVNLKDASYLHGSLENQITIILSTTANKWNAK
jgi:hypothetical protein